MDDPTTTSATTTTTSLQFTVLYGSQTSKSGAFCGLLELSGCKILLDCGWDTRWDTAVLEPLEKISPDINLVLISHADVEHVGALPYAFKKFKLNAPVYLTAPNVKFVHLALFDAVLNGGAPYTLDDVEECMDNANELKYKQVLDILTKQRDAATATTASARGGGGGGGGENIKVRAYNSGRTLGGAVWHVSQEPALEILYANDALHRKEGILNALDMSAVVFQPTLLIQDVMGLNTVWNPEVGGSGIGAAARREALIQRVMDTLRRGGDVLIPVDSCGRVFDLLIALNDHWKSEGLSKAYDLVFLTRVASAVHQATSFLDQWGNGNKDNVPSLSLSNVIVVDSLERLDAASSSPRVVLCGDVDMSRNSFSRAVFLRFVSQNPNSRVIFTQPSRLEGSLGRQLCSIQQQQENQGRGGYVTVDEERTVALEGEELVRFQESRRVRLEERERERRSDVELRAIEASIEDESGVPAAASSTNTASSAVAALTSPGRKGGASVGALASNRETIAGGILSTSAVPAGVSAGAGEDAQMMFGVARGGREEVWDVYGVVADETWLMDEEARRAANVGGTEDGSSAGVGATSGGSGSTAIGAGRVKGESQEGEGEEEKEEEALPEKVITVMLSVPYVSLVSTVDLEARMEGADLAEVVKKFKPKKLVLFRAALRVCEDFAFACQAACGKAFYPAPGECLDVATNSPVVRVRLPEETVATFPPSVAYGKSIKIQRVRGRLALPQSTAVESQQQPQKKQRRALLQIGTLPSIVPASASEGGETNANECYFIAGGNPTLNALREHLKARNIAVQVDFPNKLLKCGKLGEVLVFLPRSGENLLVGGQIGDSFFTIRSAVYDFFALV